MPEPSVTVRAAARLHTDALLRHQNVVAVGAGTRRTGGELTDEPAVVTYVTGKVPEEALSAADLVPSLVPIDESEVRTDVVEVGVPRFVDVDTAVRRPVVGGCQIGTAGGGAGTAGAVMYDRRDGNVVLLTNNHVLTDLADPTALPADMRIFQPAGGAQVGQSRRVVPMIMAPLGASGYRWFGTVDAGIVALDPGIGASFRVLEIGRHPYVVLPPFQGLEVVRRGFRTQHRVGTVDAVDMTVVITAGNGDRYKIGGPGGVFSIRSREREISAMPGDSGSLVVDADGGASRGLVFASDGQSGGITWACELGTVMTLLDLDTACTGGLNAQIRRAVTSRALDRWALLTRRTSEHLRMVGSFRREYLSEDAEGSSGSAIGSALHRLAPALAEAVAYDEDAAGLLDRGFGDWLVEPSAYAMLEHVFTEEEVAAAVAGLMRVERHAADDDDGRASDDLRMLAEVFGGAAGRSARDLIGLGYPEGDMRGSRSKSGADPQP